MKHTFYNLAICIIAASSIWSFQEPVAQATASIPNTWLSANSSEPSQCLLGLSSQLQSSCNSNVSREVALIKLMTRYYPLCLEKSIPHGNSSDALLDCKVLVPEDSYNAALLAVVAFQGIDNSTGIQLTSLDYESSSWGDFQAFYDQLWDLATNTADLHSAWLLLLGENLMQALGGMELSLDRFRNDDQLLGNYLQWDDIYPAYQALATYNTSLLQMPLDGSALMMFYRRDWFIARNISVPQTWQDVLTVAHLFNNTDLNNDTTRDYGFCFSRDPDGSVTSLFVAILGSFLQYQGTAQGVLFDPLNLNPLLNSTGAVEAAKILQQLQQLAPQLLSDQSIGANATISYDFAYGRCAMTVSYGYLWKAIEANTTGHASYVKGRLGVAPMPGSSIVWDRVAQGLVNCTAVLCPFGLKGEPEAVTSQLAQGRNVTKAYVNRAYYMMTAGIQGAVNQAVSAVQQQKAYQYLALFSSPQMNMKLALSSMPILPFRRSTLSLERLPDYVQADFDKEDTRQYLTVQALMLNSSNIATNPKIANMYTVFNLLGSATLQLLAGGNPATTMNMVQQTLNRTVITPLAADPQQFANQLAMYQLTIGYVPPAMPPQDAPPAPEGALLDGPIPAVSLAVPITSGVIVLLLSVLYEMRKHRKNKSLFGKVVPPSVSLDTTLLVTDIQDSTSLWELLPSCVMDKAMKEHHQAIRKLLLKHNGYESATEGDSFILSFHCPEDALLFAMEAQVALLHCDWPHELLELDACRPFHVIQTEFDKRKAGVVLDNNLTTAEGQAGSATGSAGSFSTPMGNTPSSSTPSQQPGPGTYQHNNSGTSNAAGVTQSCENKTFLSACQNGWREGNAAMPNNVLIFRGLRVRMGMHTGIHNEADVAYNKAAARVQYSGEALYMAKSVSDAAAGGMILLSDTTYHRLPMERLWDKAMVMHIGEYLLKEDMMVLDMYQVTSRRLLGRLGYLGTMRYKSQLSKGVLAAPLGNITLVCMGVVGAPVLLAWNEAVFRMSLRMFMYEAMSALRTCNGNLVEATDSMVHVAFHNAAEALVWCINMHQALLVMDWPLQLLQHELCEELVLGDAIVFRGLRLKTGVDTGDAVGEINALTGRICYRGKVVNRVERIMCTAASNQVLCSSETWNAASAHGLALVDSLQLAAERLGAYKLKGVVERVELLQCSTTAKPIVSQSHYSLDHEAEWHAQWQAVMNEGLRDEVDGHYTPFGDTFPSKTSGPSAHTPTSSRYSDVSPSFNKVSSASADTSYGMDTKCSAHSGGDAPRCATSPSAAAASADSVRVPACAAAALQGEPVQQQQQQRQQQHQTAAAAAAGNKKHQTAAAGQQPVFNPQNPRRRRASAGPAMTGGLGPLTATGSSLRVIATVFDHPNRSRLSLGSTGNSPRAPRGGQLVGGAVLTSQFQLHEEAPKASWARRSSTSANSGSGAAAGAGSVGPHPMKGTPPSC